MRDASDKRLERAGRLRLHPRRGRFAGEEFRKINHLTQLVRGQIFRLLQQKLCQVFIHE